MPKGNAAQVIFGVRGIDGHDIKVLEFGCNDPAFARRVSIAVMSNFVLLTISSGKPFMTAMGLSLVNMAVPL